MKRKKFLKSLLPMMIIPTLAISKNQFLEFPFKDSIEWEFIGNEKFNSDFSIEVFTAYTWLDEDEYKIDFSSGKIVDCELGEYRISRNWSDAIFCINFDIYFNSRDARKRYNNHF